MAVKFTPSEDFECASFVRWLELQRARGLKKFSHLPTSTPTNKIQAARLQRLGVRRGVPDYLLVIHSQIVFLEMKKVRGGRVSAEQEEWIDALKLTAAVVHVCEGFEEAQRVVSNLLDQWK